jgi:hypothetical protein
MEGCPGGYSFIKVQKIIVVLSLRLVRFEQEKRMPKINVSVSKTWQEFAGNKYTTFARFNLKPLDGGRIFVYEGNATGSDFRAKCERLKRQPTTVDVPKAVSVFQSDCMQSVVQLALDHTSA